MTGRDDRIRARAYDLWQQAGRPEGRSDEFWSEAAREIEADESGADPVPVDAVPSGGDSERTVTADIDRLTPSEATSATMERSADRTRSAPEAETRKPL